MQQDLFTQPDAVDSKNNSEDPVETLYLDPERLSFLQFYRGFLNPDRAASLFKTLQKDVPWRQDRIRIAGKEIPIPRLQAWFGNIDAQYGYSGIALTPIPFSPTLSEIKNAIEATCGDNFNSLLANYYRDGQDSVSWHADDETELGTNPVIASLSLGETRRFSLKHKHDKSFDTLHLDLHQGDLLIMAGETQHHWLHQVAKTKKTREPRINLTFRKIYVK
ncbi:MAG: alpha-ketoglutarate-dependent dioxygenase AlkB [Pseudomonadales bacterium]|nr:alpha-ketoglutarate-dependent dioxygenase AlkB [Pseudomonadales bacterium]